MGPAQPVSRHPALRFRRRLPRARVPWVRRIGRDPAALRRWLVVGALAWCLAALVTRALDRAEQAEQRWGRTTSVWVTEVPLRAGEPFAGRIHRIHVPAALVPSAAAAGSLGGTRAAGPIDAGSVVTGRMVERPGGPRRTVAVPLADAHLPVQEGDRVDVWATTDPATEETGTATTRRIAVAARVVATGDGSVVLEVAPAQVAALTEAAATATVTLAGEP